MGFIRENILKIAVFIVILIIAIIIFVFAFGGNKNSGTTADSYSNMEKLMVSATSKYVNDNKKLLPNSEKEVSKINLDTLENEKYINILTSPEDNNIKCTGYVEIFYKGGDYSYVPYLKCGSKYETRTMASYIRDNVTKVTMGDGLYDIGGTLVYKGENPNNYLLLGNKLYRIIDVKDQEVKLISTTRLDTYIQWDDRYNAEKDDYIGINDYTVSRVKETLKSIYEEDKLDDSYDYAAFSKEEKEKIIPHDLCIGKRNLDYGEINSYNECQKVEPNQYVGLLTVSDYARASIDSNCNSIFSKSCINYNYFSNISTSFVTLTGVANNSYQVYYIWDGVADVTKAYNSFNPYVVVYIGESSIYYKGDGTKENPYIVR